MSNQLRRIWDAAVKGATQRAWEYGVLVALDGSVAVPGRTDYVFVKVANQTITQARNEAGLPHTAGLAVRMLKDHGTYAIYGRSNTSELAAPTETPADGVPPHEHDVTAAQIAAAINGTTTKATPVNADRFAIINSVGSVLAYVTWANIKATIKTYLDTLYVALTGAQTVAGDKTLTGVTDMGSFGAIPSGTQSARAKVADDFAGITGIHAYNPNNGISSEFRHIVYDNAKGSYLAFSMPANGNTGTIFGLARSTLALLFNAGNSNLRHLAIGTFHASDLIFGTNNAERMRIEAGGQVLISTASLASFLATARLNIQQASSQVGIELHQNANFGVATTFINFTANSVFGSPVVGSIQKDASDRFIIDSPDDVKLHSENRIIIDSDDGDYTFGSMVYSEGGIAISNTPSVPGANPVGGGVLYVQSGALKYRGSSGTVTTIAPA